jgi:hypothetical protein
MGLTATHEAEPVAEETVISPESSDSESDADSDVLSLQRESLIEPHHIIIVFGVLLGVLRTGTPGFMSLDEFAWTLVAASAVWHARTAVVDRWSPNEVMNLFIDLVPILVLMLICGRPEYTMLLAGCCVHRLLLL